jgi:hypothetical protein
MWLNAMGAYGIIAHLPDGCLLESIPPQEISIVA